MRDGQLVYNRLVEVACRGEVVPVCEVAGLLGLNYRCPQAKARLCEILSEISCQENAAGRPLLSAVAVLPEIGYPEMGFFLLARELGLDHFADERSFYQHELRRVHDFWKEHIPVMDELQLNISNQVDVRDEN